MDWVLDFELLELVVVNKRGEKIEVLALELKALLDKKTVFICCWFDIDGVKVEKVELLVCQKNQYLICRKFQSV